MVITASFKPLVLLTADLIAETGGISVRRNVSDQIRDKLDIEFEERSEIEVNNIVRPARERLSNLP